MSSTNLCPRKIEPRERSGNNRSTTIRCSHALFRGPWRGLTFWADVVHWQPGLSAPGEGRGWRPLVWGDPARADDDTGAGRRDRPGDLGAPGVGRSGWTGRLRRDVESDRSPGPRPFPFMPMMDPAVFHE